MTKIQHLQFLALMLPSFVLLAAAAVSLADLAHPASLEAQAVAMAESMAAQAAEDRWNSE